MSAGRRLPPDKREVFQEPVGYDIHEKDLETLNAKNFIIAVGDVVSLTMRKNGIVPLLSIYDGYTERRELTEFADLVKNENLSETVVSNPAGEITRELEEAVKNALAGKSERIIRVEGEEDLALLPCVLYAPENTVVIYGWPGRGMKAVDTDGPTRTHIRHLFDMMEE
ncbi:MAG: GTP-dependent dephospho-CoA kinase family protein [archaeon]|nr:GTP-dependent dephospho-CoA kinase family protein [archaeon]